MINLFHKFDQEMRPTRIPEKLMEQIQYKQVGLSSRMVFPRWVLRICGRLSTFPLQEPATHSRSCQENWLLVSLSLPKVWFFPGGSPCPVTHRCRIQYTGPIGLLWGHLWIAFPAQSTLWGLVKVFFVTTLLFNFSKFCCPASFFYFQVLFLRQYLINFLYTNLCLRICFQGTQCKMPYNFKSHVLHLIIAIYITYKMLTARVLRNVVVSLANRIEESMHEEG